jgi:hypothetical protein
MSGPEAKNPAPAGISAPDDLDVADLFERLREELRRGAGSGGGAGSEFAATRALAERFWPVTAEREGGGGPKGLVKRILRKLMRWYVEPLAADQRVFNSSVLKLVDALSERADAAARVERARARARGAPDARRAARRAGAAAPPRRRSRRSPRRRRARLLRVRERGCAARRRFRERQRRYVDDFRDARAGARRRLRPRRAPRLLREAGIEARGVDADADMVAYARGEGSTSSRRTRRVPRGLEDGSLGGIFMAQVVEHLPPACSSAARARGAKLRPGGVLVAETINPLSPLALRNYFADLTHAQPLVPRRSRCSRAGRLRATEIRYLNEPAEPHRAGDPIAPSGA